MVQLARDHRGKCTHKNVSGSNTNKKSASKESRITHRAYSDRVSVKVATLLKLRFDYPEVFSE